ncbi:MAG: sugar phosphate isomerase/epimerase [Nitrospinota bacterium]|nr:MAG: sugar phosphate isomerase/epimerase [Nitrospinota bacterium]
MRLAIMSDEVSQDFARVVRFAREFALEGIELRSVYDKPPQELSPGEVRDIRSMATDAGLTICAIATPVGKCAFHSAREKAETLRIFGRCLDLAKQCHTSLLRVFTFWREEHPCDLLPRIADWFHQHLIPQARECGVRLMVENEASTNLGGKREIETFLPLVYNVDSVTLAWDPCNVLFLPEPEDPWEETFPQARPYIGHVHLKDARRGPTPAETVHVALGEGDARIREHLQYFLETHFPGWISLETHWRMQQLDREIMRLPAGSEFSQGAEPASRECMQRLQRMIARLGPG